MLGILFAMRAQLRGVRIVAQGTALLIGYGAVAQFAPVTLLPLLSPAALAALAFASCRLNSPRLAPAAAASVALIAAWAFVPVVIWSGAAMLSLGGVPLVIDAAQLTPAIIAKQILVPAAAFALALWQCRAQLPRKIRLALGLAASVLAVIGVHALYRIGFAQIIGDDFIRFGLAQRLVWEALQIGCGWLLWRSPTAPARTWLAPLLIGAGTLHAFWFTLLLHNPLWAEQAVGALPLANLLLPAFGLVFIGFWLLRTMLPSYAERAERPFQLIVMALVAGFAWATLRQLFHGSLLVDPGVFDAEDILRSILAIGLAVGFLLWGIRTQQRDWRIASLVLLIGAVGKVFLFDASGLEGLMRIASFVALGFSLIGIGWLYSRQLGRDAGEEGVSDVRA